MECGAIQDVLEVCGALSPEDNAKAKAELDRIVAMLTRLGRRGYVIREGSAGYGAGRIDPDPDPEGGRDGAEHSSAPDRRHGADRQAGGVSLRRRLVSLGR